MRVNIEYANKSAGLLFTKSLPQVCVTVDFSPEELQRIKQLGILDRVLVKRVPHEKELKKYNRRDWENIQDAYWLRVKDLVKNRPDTFTFDALVDAQSYERELTEALKTLKSHIAEDVSTASKTFEL